MKNAVVCVPGSVAPASERYRPLQAMVGDRAELFLKDLEVYREPKPSADYAIEEEVDAIDRFAESSGLDQFHLVAYSGGGFISLAYAGTRPGRLLSLGLFEPARIPGELTAEERAFFSGLEDKLAGLSGPDFMSTFIREQVKPGAVLPLPPSGPPSAEMQKRPAGIAALIRAFEVYDFDRNRLREVRFPVYYGYGDLSHQEQAVKAGILAQLFADIHVQRFAGVHHFVPADQIYTRAHVDSLLGLWARGEMAQPVRA